MNNILTPKERKYLYDFLRPFRNRVLCIQKTCEPNNLCYLEIIMIGLKEVSYREYILLPYFHNGDMYVGMEPDREYTPEELRLYHE